MIRLRALVLFALLLAPPALAEPRSPGIGFVQSVEGTWWCRDGDAAKAFDCAARKCRAEAGSETCVATRWCAPAGWSGLMVIWLPEFHNTVALCGTPSQAALVAAFKALCAGDEVVTRCEFVAVIDPDGKETAIEDTNWPGPTMGDPPSSQ